MTELQVLWNSCYSSLLLEEIVPIFFLILFLQRKEWRGAAERGGKRTRKTTRIRTTKGKRTKRKRTEAAGRKRTVRTREIWEGKKRAGKSREGASRKRKGGKRKSCRKREGKTESGTEAKEWWSGYV